LALRWEDAKGKRLDRLRKNSVPLGEKGPGLKPALFSWLYAEVETSASLRKYQTIGFPAACTAPGVERGRIQQPRPTTCCGATCGGADARYPLAGGAWALALRWEDAKGKRLDRLREDSVLFGEKGPGLKPALFSWLYAEVETSASLRKYQTSLSARIGFVACAFRWKEIERWRRERRSGLCRIAQR